MDIPALALLITGRRVIIKILNTDNGGPKVVRF